MKKNISEIASIFDILSNEVRLCIILDLYYFGEKKVGELQDCTNSSQSFVSQQLSKLKLLGIINSKKSGNEVYYSLNDGKIKDIITKLNIRGGEYE